MQTIRPIEFLEIPKWAYPIFLAWPIRWAWWWQAEARRYLEEKTKSLVMSIIVIDPSRDIIDWIWAKKLTPWYENRFYRQREWERYYLDSAANNWWTVLFWLPNQKDIIPNNPDWTQVKSYWSTTRQELWTAMIRYPLSITVWIDEKFPERSIIEDDLKFYTSNKEFIVHKSLEETCNMVIDKIKWI